MGGTGIGLSVVLECIQAHDGTVELIDSDEFPGAHFRIQIPQTRDVAREKLVANGDSRTLIRSFMSSRSQKTTLEELLSR